MVDIVSAADTVLEAEEVVDCGEDIVTGDVSGAELSHIGSDFLLDCINVAGAAFDDFIEQLCADLALYTAIGKIVTDDLCRPAGAV